MTNHSNDSVPVGSEFLLYTAPKGAVTVNVLFKDETAWLTQKGLAELFGVGIPAIAKHLKNAFDFEELCEESVIFMLETTAADRQQKNLLLPLIIWATWTGAGEIENVRIQYSRIGQDATVGQSGWALPVRRLRKAVMAG